jgi:hypothetical protein
MDLLEGLQISLRRLEGLRSEVLKALDGSLLKLLWGFLAEVDDRFISREFLGKVAYGGNRKDLPVDHVLRFIGES